MAEAGKGGFVDAIVKDPANPPQVKLVVGYLGKSETAGHTRIYANPELTEHIDVPDATVLHTLDVPNDHLGAKYVWIQKDADVIRRDRNKTEVRAKFLAGPLSAAAEVAPAAAAAAPAAPQVSFGLPCPTPSFNLRCTSDLGTCPSVDICATQLPHACNPQPTVIQAICHTRIPINCQPSLIEICQTLQVAHCPPLVTRPNICRTLQPLDCFRTLRPVDCFPTVNILECHRTRDFFCPSQVIPCQSQGIICNTPGTITGGSAVDACPSAMCGTAGITFNPLM